MIQSSFDRMLYNVMPPDLMLTLTLFGQTILNLASWHNLGPWIFPIIPIYLSLRLGNLIANYITAPKVTIID